MAHVVHNSANQTSWNCPPASPIDRLPLAYVEFDHDVRILDWNAAAERLFGYSKREAVGNIALELMLPGPPSCRVRDIVNRIWAGDFDAHSLNANRTKDGRVIDCYWFNTPIFDESGHVIGGCGMGRKIRIAQDPDVGVIQSGSDKVDGLALLEQLTARQRQILQLVVSSHRTRDIASELKISVKTVEMHRANIMGTLKVHDVAGLTRFAVRVGLVSA